MKRYCEINLGWTLGAAALFGFAEVTVRSGFARK
jgi:hypothetical protein